MKMKLLGLVTALLVIFGCGGGGGGTPVAPATLVGRVLSVSTGGPVAPAATVQVGAQTTTTAADGSFTLNVPGGTTSLTVNAGSFGAWTFAIPSAAGTADVGDLWVGPNRVTVQGRVLNASNSAPVVGASVKFAGRSGLTNAQGTFTLGQVAYDAATQTAFWGIRGSADATDFFRSEWNAQPNVATSGRVIVNDVLLTPLNSDIPPPPPHNLWGKVAPSAQASGAIATLKQGTTEIRRYTVGADGAFYFWVTPGTYTIEVVKGTLDGTASATLTRQNELVRKDVTLN